MSQPATKFHRRGFLKGALSAGAAVMAPTIIPSSALGLGGSVAPSERIVLGGIGIGNRGTYDLGCFLEQKDVQFVAVCDVKATRRNAVKKMVDQYTIAGQVTQQGYYCFFQVFIIDHNAHALSA